MSILNSIRSWSETARGRKIVSQYFRINTGTNWKGIWRRLKSCMTGILKSGMGKSIFGLHWRGNTRISEKSGAGSTFLRLRGFPYVVRSWRCQVSVFSTSTPWHPKPYMKLGQNGIVSFSISLAVFLASGAACMKLLFRQDLQDYQDFFGLVYLSRPSCWSWQKYVFFFD